MPAFTNQATLSYQGNVVNSNIVTGELQEVLAITKTAVTETYNGGDTKTYVVTIVNSGTTPFTGLTVTDDLGRYDYTGGTAPVSLVPQEYVDGSVRYYVNGVLQTAPTAAGGPPLTIGGINVPAGGNATLVYEVRLNEFAPLGDGGTVANNVTLSGAGATPVTALETITAADTVDLAITKALNPTVVTENGELTYTFTIENRGGAEADAAEGIVLTDTFNPILNPITATLNGNTLTEGTDYTYDRTTGIFTVNSGVITVPAATFTQDTATGRWNTVPGTSTLTVTGTV